MQRISLTSAAVALATALSSAQLAAQQHDAPTLHVNPRWRECSFQLSSSLSKNAWRQFTREAGLVTYFRPLADAKPMGKGKFEVSMLQWQAGIDHHDDAWNDTFVHPDSAHYLFEGSRLKIPGLMVRAGVGDKTDVGLYFTKSPGPNYGFVGGQVQRSLVGGASREWAAAARLSFTSLYGPEDLDFSVIGWDVVASRDIRLTTWAVLSPYAGVSSYLARAHEKSAVVALKDEYEGGSQVMVGATIKLSGVRLAMEYNRASVNSVSLKLGFAR